MAAAKSDKDPVVESQEKAIKDLNLEEIDPEVTTARNPYPADEVEEDEEPESKAKKS